MIKRLVVGVVLAVSAALIIWIGAALGLDVEHVALLGVALGGVVGLVPGSTPMGRLTGFLIGFVVAWIGYLLRAAVLPDTTSGRAVAALLVVGIITLICGLLAERAPLWAGLVGAAALVGAYEVAYTATPSRVLQESPAAATTVLLAAAVGFAVTVLVQDAASGTARHEPRRATRPPTEPAPTNDLDSILAGETK